VDPLTTSLLIAAAVMTTAKKPWKWPAAAEPYRGLIEAASRDHGVPRDMLARLLWEESRFRPDIITGQVRSPVGALGIAQFMPATAREMGIDPLKPEQAIPAGARYVRQQYDRFGSWRLALVAYNWGPGNVSRALKAKRPMLADADGYASRILGDSA
jgi:soluble lytic murein transglycosylase-like protein